MCSYNKLFYRKIISKAKCKFDLPVVRGVKKNLLHTLAACTTDKCQRVLHDYKVNQMSVQVDFDKVSRRKSFLIFCLDYYFTKLSMVNYEHFPCLHAVHGSLLPKGMILQ